MPVLPLKSAVRAPANARRRVPDAPRPRLVVVGNGMVGWKFCAALVERGLHERWDVVVCGEEPRLAYDRVNRTCYFSCRSADDLLLLAPRDWYAAQRIDLYTGDLVVRIERTLRAVHTNLSALVPTVQALGRRHAGYGVKDEHYDTVASALIWTLEKGVGGVFTTEVREAWVGVYTILADTMKGASASATSAA